MSFDKVVYLLIPTSNHNVGCGHCDACRLFISWFLHQTTTGDLPYSTPCCCLSLDSYIKPQHPRSIYNRYIVVYLLIPTSNHNSPMFKLFSVGVVYLLIPTSNHNEPPIGFMVAGVVYLLIPTSNHNPQLRRYERYELFISWFLHQTTTYFLTIKSLSLLFISWFLHQTTTFATLGLIALSCLSLDSYIKPQHLVAFPRYNNVVYLLIPTSNHNARTAGQAP